jgi:RHS repeat-associated protein
LSFTSGQTTQPVYVSTTQDSIYENTERLYVNLSNATNAASISDSQGYGDVTNDDAGPSFSITDVSVAEGGTIAFTVTKSGSTEVSHDVSYATATGTAASGDFTATSSTLSYTSGQTSQPIYVSTTQDSIFETVERFYVNLSNATNGASISDSQGYGDIANDDAGPSFSINDVSVGEGGTLSFTVSKSGLTEVSHDVSFASATGGTAGAGDFTSTSSALTFTSGQTTQPVYVTTVQDNIYETVERLYVNLSNATGGASIGDSQGYGDITNDDSGPVFSINDGSEAEGGTLSFTVTKSGATEVTHAVTFSTSDGTAQSSQDYTGITDSLTFNPSDTSKFATVVSSSDGLMEATEHFFIALSNPSNNASITGGSALGLIDDAQAAEEESELFMLDSYADSTAAGLTPGSLSIDVMGNANYAIPIAVAPGTAGMQPELTLAYSSRGPNGPVGVGWAVGGLSAITRCPKTLVPDGEFGSINYDSDDQFCLDGARLIAITGTYGADETEYRTEIDQFARIISHDTAGSGPAYFTVETKAGRIIEYGNSGDSRIEAEGRTDVRVWAVNKIEDTVGNYMTIEYEEESDHTDFRPALMEYSMNTAASQTTPFASVEFVYESRPDVIGKLYQAESELSGAKVRLANIRSWNGSELVRDYELVYDNAGKAGASRLVSVTEKAENEEFPPLLFTWAGEDSVPDFESATVSVELPELTDWEDFIPVFGDFNGDAKTDLFLQARTATTESAMLFATIDGNGDTSLEFDESLEFSDDWAHEQSSSSATDDLRQIVTGDFNADGIADLGILHFDWVSSDSFFDGIQWIDFERYDLSFIVHHTEIDDDSIILNAKTPLLLAESEVYEPTNIHTADFNGDGRTDFIFEIIFSGTTDDVYLATTSGTFGSPLAEEVSVHQIGDFNGDGQADVVAFDSGVGVQFWDGTGFSSGVWSNQSPWYQEIADFNGDGITDYMAYGAGSLNVFFGKGDGLIGDGSYSATPDVTMSGFGTGGPIVTIGDWNGDGRADFSDDGELYISTGDVDTSTSTEFFEPLNITMNGDFRMAGDFNGDSVGDFWVKSTGSPVEHTIYLTAADDGDESVYTSDVIVAFTDSLGVVSEVEYMPMSDPEVYSRAASEFPADEYPIWTIQTARLLVERVNTEDGAGQMRSVTYDYKHAQTDLARRAGQLYGEIRITDERASIVQTTKYRQDFPFVGMPTEMRREYDNGGTLVQLSVTQYEYPDNDGSDPAVETHDGVYFPHARRQTTRSYELTRDGGGAIDGSALVAITETLTPDEDFDDFGNLEQVVANVYNDEGALTNQTPVATSTTVNVFDIDEPNWLIGQLVCQTETVPEGQTTRKTVSGFTYATGTGLVTSEVIEPISGMLTNCLSTATDENVALSTTFEYDLFGNRTDIYVDDHEQAEGGSLPVRHTQITFGELNEQYEVVADNGRFPVIVTNAEGHTERRRYDGRFGTMTRLKGPNDLVTRWNYDGFGRLTSEIRADGTRSDLYRAFCSASSPCPEIDDVIKVMSLETGAPASVVISDKFGRETHSATVGFDGTPVITSTLYDNHGRVASIEKPYLHGARPEPELLTEFTYDELGRVITEKAPGESLGTRTEYLSFGTVSIGSSSIEYRAGLDVTNEKGQTTSRYVDALGRMVASVDAADIGTAYGHDAHGNVTSIEVNGDSTTKIENTYDILGRKLSMRDRDLSPDPNDEWTYRYNSFGELRQQTDSTDAETRFAYDRIGRLTLRTDNYGALEPGVTELVYDDEYKGIGQLVEVTGPEGDIKSFTFDDDGRLATTTTTLPDGAGVFVTGQSFDSAGRVNLVTYPESTAYTEGLQVRYEYNDRGYLSGVYHHTSNEPYWTLNEQTATLTEYSLGNGVSTSIGYDEVTGRLLRIVSSTMGESGDIQDLEYEYDTIGNLTRRTDRKRGVQELISSSAGYDSLNRIVEVERETKSGTVWGGTTPALDLEYDELGNIREKTGLATFEFDTPDATCDTDYAGPHAVTGIGAAIFCYDRNGNETKGYDFSSSSTRETTWTPFNKPATITDGTHTVSFEYGADRARFRQINGFTGTTTLYVDGIFERETVAGAVTDIHYIFAGGEAVAIYKSHDDETEETLYLHKDNLGSVVEITDESHAIYESLSYDAFGQRRDPDDWYSSVSYPEGTPRGYTGHEHLEQLNLVHMNGRVYDPGIGRMISPDPLVQFADESQSFNRYSYVLNNPLRYTDPSGFCIAGGPSCPMSGLGGFSGGGAGGSSFRATLVHSVSTSITNILMPVIGRIYRLPTFGSVVPPSNPWHRNVLTCLIADPYCGTMNFTGYGGNAMDHSLGAVIPIEVHYGVIGYALLQHVGIQVYSNLFETAQAWFAHLDEGAPVNAVAGLQAHASHMERPSGAGGSPVTGAAGNPNTSPGLGSALMDLSQAAIGVAGMIPWIGNLADGVNAGISALRGDYVGAAMDGASAIPGVGAVTGAGNIARRTASAAAGIASAAGQAARAVGGAVKGLGSAIGGLFRRGRGNDIVPNSNLPVPIGERTAIDVLGGPAVTPGGRTITDHAARQMRNPPPGRVQASPLDVDAVLDGGQVRKRSFPVGGETLTIRNSSLPGNPDVVVDAATGNRVITVIKREEF